MRRAAWLVLGMLCSAPAFAVGCAAGADPVDERRFGRGDEAITVQLCHDAKPVAGGPAGSLAVTALRGDLPVAKLSLPIDVEGELRKIRFDGASYALGDKVPAIPVLLEARLHGATFDQYDSDLWLIRFDGKALSLVLAQPISRESWGTDCEPDDCIEASSTRSLLIISPEIRRGSLSDLRVRTRRKDAPRGTHTLERFVFNGQRYERPER